MCSWHLQFFYLWSQRTCLRHHYICLISVRNSFSDEDNKKYWQTIEAISVEIYNFFPGIYLIVNMCTMVLTLISSTIVLHLHSIKHTPMPLWVETLFRLLAAVFCVGTRTNDSIRSSKEETPPDPTFENMVTYSEEIKNTKENGAIGREDSKKILESNNSMTESNKWIWCASVLERMFLVIWFLLYLASMGLLVVIAVGFNKEWETL